MNLIGKEKKGKLFAVLVRTERTYGSLWNALLKQKEGSEDRPL